MTAIIRTFTVILVISTLPKISMEEQLLIRKITKRILSEKDLRKKVSFLLLMKLI